MRQHRSIGIRIRYGGQPGGGGRILVPAHLVPAGPEDLPLLPVYLGMNIPDFRLVCLFLFACYLATGALCAVGAARVLWFVMASALSEFRAYLLRGAYSHRYWLPLGYLVVVLVVGILSLAAGTGWIGLFLSRRGIWFRRFTRAATGRQRVVAEIAGLWVRQGNEG